MQALNTKQTRCWTEACSAVRTPVRGKPAGVLGVWNAALGHNHGRSTDLHATGDGVHKALHINETLACLQAQTETWAGDAGPWSCHISQVGLSYCSSWLPKQLIFR